MKIGVDYVSSADVKNGKEGHAKKVGHFDYVPAGGLPAKEQRVVKPEDAAGAAQAIKKPEIKKTDKPGAANEATPLITKPDVTPPPGLIGQKRE